MDAFLALLPSPGSFTVAKTFFSKGRIEIPTTKELPQPVESARLFKKQPRKSEEEAQADRKKRVIRLDTACEIVLAQLSDNNISLDILDAAIGSLSPLGMGPDQRPSGADRIIREMEGNTLPQNSGRKFVTYRYAKREI